jgi:hypothetical protein
VEYAGLPPEGHTPLPGAVDLDAETEIRLLEEIRDGVRSEGPSMALTDDAVPPVLNSDFPVQGSSRWVVPRKAVGGRIVVPSIVVPNVVMVANSNRAAGTIVNMGNADCLLILARVEEKAGPGLGMIFLSAKGGSWDMRLGPPLWCGSVSALALKTISGEVEFKETELTIVEV